MVFARRNHLLGGWANGTYCLQEPKLQKYSTAFPGSLQIVGNDGRLLIEDNGKLKAILRGGPSEEVERRESESTLSADIKRSKDKTR